MSTSHYKGIASECCTNKLTTGHIGFLVVFDAVSKNRKSYWCRGGKEGAKASNYSVLALCTSALKTKHSQLAKVLVSEMVIDEIASTRQNVV